MTDQETIDYEARRLASQAQSSADRAMDKIENNQQMLKDALRRQESFEVEMRTGQKDLIERTHHVEVVLLEKIDSIASDFHSRLNTLMRMALGGSIGIASVAIGAALIYLLGW